MIWWDKFLEINAIAISLGLGSFGVIAKGIVSQIKKSKEQVRANQAENEKRFSNLEYANVALLHDKIYSRCTEALNDGWISVDDLENLEYLWRGYKNLGGNGTGETIYNKVCALPTKK